jgi:hypothetical protein
MSAMTTGIATLADYGADPAMFLAGLRALPGFGDVAPDDLEPMPVKGLVHAHIRIRGRGLVLRVPRLSHFGHDPVRSLEYQAACFERAWPSGATPRLHGVIPVQPGIPNGALVVEEIIGRALVLPGDLAAVAKCLAAIHVLPVPDAAACPPLALHADPVAATVAVIEAQAEYLPDTGFAREALARIEDEIDWARGFAAQCAGRDQPVTLVGTDTHPGNYLIDRAGRAVFVDLEKGLYGAPAIDLAHASVYTSTMWEPDSATALDGDDVAEFYRHYLACVPAALGDRIAPWFEPLRRLTWLRTTTWCAKWWVETARPARGASSWSADRLDRGHVAAVRARIRDYYDPATIDRIRAEWLG